MGYTFVSGHLALDLAGTVGHRHAPDRYELLDTPARLATWTVEAGVLDSPPAAADAQLAQTLALRETVYRLARARLDGSPGTAADRAALNAAAQGAPVAVRLREDGSLARDGDLAAVQCTIARAAVELLGGSGGGALKACESAPCSRLYLDGSRRGSRRWCDMRECGNRAKASAYRRRRAERSTG